MSEHWQTKELGLEEERKKTWVQEKEGVVGKELVGVDLAVEATSGSKVETCAANVAHQELVVPGASMVVDKPAITVPQVQYFVLLKLWESLVR